VSESAEFRWGNVTQCCSCGSEDIERQTAEEGRPFSCNNCGLEFFKDTGEATAGILSMGASPRKANAPSPPTICGDDLFAG
jgi:hypothetical protein